MCILDDKVHMYDKASIFIGNNWMCVATRRSWELILVHRFSVHCGSREVENPTDCESQDSKESRFKPYIVGTSYKEIYLMM